MTTYNGSDVLIEEFSIRQPQFWSFLAQDSSNIELRGIYINGNSSNYVTNIDGLDTLRVDNLAAADWLFHGSDDCMVSKGNSTSLTFRNLTCIGGDVAFRSLGQHPDSPDFVRSVYAEEITVSQAVSPILSGANVSGGPYFKSWVGGEEDKPPQGGGGDTGALSNLPSSISQYATPQTPSTSISATSESQTRPTIAIRARWSLAACTSSTLLRW